MVLPLPDSPYQPENLARGDVDVDGVERAQRARRAKALRATEIEHEPAHVHRRVGHRGGAWLTFHEAGISTRG